MSSQYLIDTCFRFPGIVKKYFKLTELLNFNENYQVRIETERYLLKTANCYTEIFFILLLRYRNFLSRASTLISFGIDLDKFDSTCDHLIVIDKVDKKICGTYRLRATTYTDKFYSESEFNLDDFLKTPGVKLELGRACIDKSYRNGAVIDLLWRGIGSYAKKCQARYLFGCSSIQTLDTTEASRIYKYFVKNGLIGSDYIVSPHAHYRRDLDYSNKVGLNDIDKFKVPPLLRTYFQGGAKVYGSPAFDYSFKCIDFLTIMDIRHLNHSFKRRYF